MWDRSQCLHATGIAHDVDLIDLLHLFVLASELAFSHGPEVDRCGLRVNAAVESRRATDERQCVKCGVSCCAGCAYSVDSATYCARCAESILEVGGNAHDPLPSAAARNGEAQAPRLTIRGSDTAQWLILVAKDQSDLYGRLVRAFSRDDKVQILMDRRKDYSRNPPGMEERLRIHGAAVIRRRATC